MSVDGGAGHHVGGFCIRERDMCLCAEAEKKEEKTEEKEKPEPKKRGRPPKAKAEGEETKVRNCKCWHPRWGTSPGCARQLFRLARHVPDACLSMWAILGDSTMHCHSRSTQARLRCLCRRRRPRRARLRRRWRPRHASPPVCTTGQGST